MASWSRVFIWIVWELFKEFNTEVAKYAENTERGSLAEEILRRGAKDARSGFERGFVPITADENNGKAFRFAHEQAGGSGKFIRNG